MRKKIDKWFDEPQHVAGLVFVHIDTTDEHGEYIELSVGIDSDGFHSAVSEYSISLQ